MGLLSKEEEKEKMTRMHNEMGAVTLQNLLQAYVNETGGHHGCN